VFALEVSKGHDVVLRVVASLGDTRCVVVTKHSAPTLKGAPKAKAVFEVQPHSHHNWNRLVLGGWVSVPPPPEVRLLGNLPVRVEEAEQVVHPETWVKLPGKKPPGMAEKVVPLSGWELIVEQARRQWRWDHEREAVLAEDAKNELAQQAKFKEAIEAQAKKNEALKKKGVKGLAKTRFFASWKGEVPAPMVKDAEALMREAVSSLEGKSAAQATRRLTQLVKAFNKLDGKHEKTFDTIEREDIMDAISTVALACGVSDDDFEEKIDAERDF
jgi:hypothetical protein